LINISNKLRLTLQARIFGVNFAYFMANFGEKLGNIAKNLRDLAKNWQKFGLTCKASKLLA